MVNVILRRCSVVCTLMLWCYVAISAQVPGNPVITHMYSADPSARVFGDTLWLYPSHDKDDALNFNMEDYHVYSTTDMLKWTDHGVIFNPIKETTWAKSAAWAPDCICRNGKYYLYFPVDKRNIGVAVSDSPAGPFKDALNRPLISIDDPGVVCDRDFIDPCVFIDDDGQAYLFMGQNTVCAVRLNENMISYDGEVHIVEGVKDFFEAVWVHKRNGVYYMSYSNGPFHGHAPQIAYCTSKSPLGPYEYQGLVLDSVNSGTNHHSIVKYKGQDYLFYHTADLSRSLAPGYHCGVRRNVCYDSLHYDSEGRINKVKPTLNKAKLDISCLSDDRREALIAGAVRQPDFRKMPFAVTLSPGVQRAMLQAVIDSTSNVRGGGTVILTCGTYEMDGPLEIKSNVCLQLEDGVVINFTSDPDAYLPVVKSRWEGTELYNRCSMIHADGQSNFAIIGKGNAVINCGGKEMARWGMPMGIENFEENVHGTHGETPEHKDVKLLRQMGDSLTAVDKRVFGNGTCLRPCGVEFKDCRQVLVQGITLRDSPFWCIHPLYCEDVTVRDVTIDSQFPNNDGCDPESSRRVLIENCTFRTGDDAVAIKSGRDADGRRVGRPSVDIVIRDCRFYSKCNGLCIGSEMSGGVKNVYMSNIEIGNVKNALLFKSNLDRGGYIDSVYVDNVDIAKTSGAVLRFETNYFGYRGGHYPARYSNFQISNVKAGESDAYAIYYDGNAEQPIGNVKVSDFHVGKATKPYYLFHTKDCRFANCSVNGVAIPMMPRESKERQSCDVW